MQKKDFYPDFVGVGKKFFDLIAQRLNIFTIIASATFIGLAVLTFLWVQNGGKMPPLEKAPVPAEEQEKQPESGTSNGEQATSETTGSSSTSSSGSTSGSSSSSSSSSNPTSTPGPTSTPTPTPENTWEPWVPTPKPLASGSQTYSVSGSESGSPQTYEVTIDPLDPGVGASQSVSAKVIENGGGSVASVSVGLVTDSRTTAHSLTLVSGTDLDGTWEGTWTMEDSYDLTYQMSITAANASADWTVSLSFR